MNLTLSHITIFKIYFGDRSGQIYKVWPKKCKCCMNYETEEVPLEICSSSKYDMID